MDINKVLEDVLEENEVKVEDARALAKRVKRLREEVEELKSEIKEKECAIKIAEKVIRKSWYLIGGRSIFAGNLPGASILTMSSKAEELREALLEYDEVIDGQEQ
ncbi:MAG: hypothetical protein SVK08_00375 [Halobacteriota archaeon]|nr:hypothetical protein [Halobacteriota archaeon]